MNNRYLFALSVAGVLVACVSAFVSAVPASPQPPVFSPAADPYKTGIYASGIVESFQAQGENINIYPEVSGPVTRVFVAEGQAVRKGDPLVAIDDFIQRPATDQQKAQIDVSVAQIANAEATLKSAEDTFDKQRRAYALDPRSVSRDVLDTAENAARIARTTLIVYQRQSVEQTKAYAASSALLAKYTIRAPTDGVVLSLQASTGSYVSPQGAYGSYTEGFSPLLVMGAPQQQLQVRCSVDEILVHRLPDPSRLKAEMYVQGTNVHIPLTFVRVQPYVSPKIELSNEREERVDVRVLPVIFRFEKPKNLNLFPGQLVDVYIGGS